MSNKTIELQSGATITRTNLKGYDERWDIKNPTLSTIYVTLDLSECRGVLIVGYDDESEVTECAKPMENTTLFVIQKDPPFVFKIGFSVREDPMPIEQQLNQIAPRAAKIELQVEKMRNEFVRVPFEVMSMPQIIEAVKAYGFDNFVDPSFPPSESSIYDVTSEPVYPLDEVVIWKRPHEFMKGEPKLFEDQVDPNDIRQGALGDCWFLASVACIAENPVDKSTSNKNGGITPSGLVKRLFITDSYNEFGIYQLRVCKNGEWIVVTVDDYIPCHVNGGPMFSSCRGNELWVVLLEKAYAKLHGNYWQLRAGFVSHGMMDLTGCPTMRYSFPESKNVYDKILQYADKLWDILIKADNYGHIMCAGTPGVDAWTEGGGPDKETGIVPGHAYSVIQIKEYDDVRLLNIRNPWGQFEWGGEWCDNHRNWTSEMIEAFKPDFDASDGTFWMSYEDFFKNFDSLTVCKTQNWEELRLKGKFIRVEEEEMEGNDWVISQFYYSFVIDKSSHIEIGLHQEDERILGAEKRKNIDMSFVILKKERNGEFKVSGFADLNTARDTEGIFTLEPGSYIVVPFSTGGLLRAFDEFTDPVELKIRRNGKRECNPKLASVFNDIFRKIDLQLDGVLTARELNIFGDIVEDSFFSSLTQNSFLEPEFDEISHVTEGITRYGLFQILSGYSENKIRSILKKLGYDESLQSTKSRVFVITFHSTEKVKVKIKSAARTDLNEKAANLILADHLEKTGARKAREDEN